MTDFHIDPLYEAFGHADCNEPTCCRKGQSPKSSASNSLPFDDESLLNQTIVRDGRMLHLDLDVAPTLREIRRMAQIGGSVAKHTQAIHAEPAGYWGDFRDCDTPVWAFDDAIERIAETHKVRYK